MSEEWLLERVGLTTFRNANLLPAPGKSVNAANVYESFIHFDDKPMITGPVAVQESLQRYCTEGMYCIASGDGATFSAYYYKKPADFFSVKDKTFWRLDPSDMPSSKPEPVKPEGIAPEEPKPSPPGPPPHEGDGTSSASIIKRISVTGKVDTYRIVKESAKQLGLEFGEER
jgi:hypothetical protein